MAVGSVKHHMAILSLDEGDSLSADELGMQLCGREATGDQLIQRVALLARRRPATLDVQAPTLTRRCLQLGLLLPLAAASESCATNTCLRRLSAGKASGRFVPATMGESLGSAATSAVAELS